MSVTGYIELPIEQCREQADAHGKAYAQERGLPWPMPPARYSPGRQPEPPAAYYQRWQRGIVEEPNGELGLLVVDSVMEGRAGAVVEVGAKRVRIDVSGKVGRDSLPKKWRDKPTKDPPSKATPVDPGKGKGKGKGGKR